MAIKMSRFARDKLTMIVNFPVKLNGKNSKITSYVLDKKINVNEDVFEFLGEEYSDKKKIKALNLVKLKSSLFNIKVSSLTKLEMKKVCLAKAFLSNSKVIILEYFFEELIYSEREYFKRLFNNLINKENKQIIVITNDMDIVCESVRDFYLFTEGENFRLIDNFYDNSIYKYVKMPKTVSLVRELENKGIRLLHDYTFNEVLKGIYRGVS